MKSQAQRAYMHIEKRWRRDVHYFVADSGCWEWMKGLTKDGYACTKWRGNTRFAHMAIWEATVGHEKPTGMQLDHLCRNRRCVNPAHLELVTPRENSLRGNTIAAANAAATECNFGHAFDENNTYLRPDGHGRGCKECVRRRCREYQRQRRERYADA